MNAEQIRKEVNQANWYGAAMLIYLCLILGFFWLVW